MKTPQTIQEVLILGFNFAAWTVLAVLGMNCLFRTREVQAYWLKRIEKDQASQFGRWLARWYPFYSWNREFMKTPIYLWYLRLWGIMAIFMGAVGIVLPLLSLLLNK